MVKKYFKKMYYGNEHWVCSGFNRIPLDTLNQGRQSAAEYEDTSRSEKLTLLERLYDDFEKQSILPKKPFGQLDPNNVTKEWIDYIEEVCFIAKQFSQSLGEFVEIHGVMSEGNIDKNPEPLSYFLKNTSTTKYLNLRLLVEFYYSLKSYEMKPTLTQLRIDDLLIELRLLNKKSNQGNQYPRFGGSRSSNK